jgi:hypothetical protein
MFPVQTVPEPDYSSWALSYDECDFRRTIDASLDLRARARLFQLGIVVRWMQMNDFMVQLFNVPISDRA